tara:strand:- start:91 stop:675 length:585 start_codon:yes stop_codon:yes gene_type:complete
MSIKIYPPNYLFPTKILMSCDNDFISYRDDMVAWMNTYAQKNEGVNKSNIGGYQSPDNFYLEESFAPYMNRISEHIMSTLEEYLDDDMCSINRNNISLGNMWFNFNYPHNYNVYHVHPNCVLAGVLWVQTVDDTNIRFECLDAFARGLTEKRTNESFTPKEGQLVLFPSHIPHMVDQNNTEETRISISFNIQGG